MRFLGYLPRRFVSLTLNCQVAETVYGDENVTMNKQLPDIIMANEEDQNGHDVSKVLYFMERVVLFSILEIIC